MFKSKNQFKTIYLSLIAFIGLLFIFNNHQLIAMNNQNNNIINEIVELNNQLTEKLKEQELIIAKIVDQNFHEEIITEEFNNQVILLNNSILNLKDLIHVLSERQIIDEKMDTFINQRNDYIIEIINSQGVTKAKSIVELIHINRQISCLNKRQNRLNSFIKNNLNLNNNEESFTS
ncbi:MAG: SVM family protein ['Conium maculatum' witches'-broom phytoplasma]|nr:SVM family protein ['Conium maculatum' witches'-broom phytoplasma]